MYERLQKVLSNDREMKLISKYIGKTEDGESDLFIAVLATDCVFNGVGTSAGIVAVEGLDHFLNIMSYEPNRDACLQILNEKWKKNDLFFCMSQDIAKALHVVTKDAEQHYKSQDYTIQQKAAACGDIEVQQLQVSIKHPKRAVNFGAPDEVCGEV